LSKRYIAIVLFLILLINMSSLSNTFIFDNDLKYVKSSISYLNPPVVDGDPRDWPPLLKLHPNISIDGKIYDWYTEKYIDPLHRITRNVKTNISMNIYVWVSNDTYNNVNYTYKYLYYRGEFIWFDAIKDTLSNTTYDPGLDISEVRVSGDQNNLYLLIRFVDLKTIGREGSPLISIPIDIDMNWNNGNTSTIDPYTNVSIYAPWDYQVVIDLSNENVSSGVKIYGNETPFQILNPKGSNVATSNSCFVADIDNDVVEIAISWSDLGVINPWNISNVRMYVLVFKGDGKGHPLIVNNGGSNVIDLVSNTVTDKEVSDKIVDYWLDIGFTTACEPTYYYHHILDDKGYIQAYSDLAGDQRTDYIVNEAFDVDIISTTLWITRDYIYILIHMRGLVKPRDNISPAIAIVIDTTIDNISDGYDSWIHVPSGVAVNQPYTDTELGVPPDLPLINRSWRWNYIIWIFSNITGGADQYRIYLYNGTIIYQSDQTRNTVKASEHFIEALIPTFYIPDIVDKPFRWVVLSYAYVLETSLILDQPKNGLLDITGSNIYDVIAPYPTYSVEGIQVINGKPYAVNAEVYDIDNDPRNDNDVKNGDHWVDVYTGWKYYTKIVNLTLNYISYDTDDYIEIGEYAWVYATLVYYNGIDWTPLSNRNVTFYLISIDYKYIVYLGSNTSLPNGTIVLYLGDIASRVKSNYYFIEAVYNPDINDQFYYTPVSNTSSVFIVLNQPFTSVLPEPLIAPILIMTLMIVVSWRRRRTTR